MILLSVLTAPRKGVDYLRSTLEQLDREGADLCDEKWIFPDGHLVSGDATRYAFEQGKWRLGADTLRVGHRLAMWRVFNLAVDRMADWLIFCEDDLNVAPDAVRRIVANAAELFSDLAFLAYFDRRISEGFKGPCGLYAFPCLSQHDESERFVGTLCMLFPRAVLNYLVACDPLDTPPFPGYHSGDAALAYHLSRSPWPMYGVHIPCLVDHLGDVSATGTVKAPIRGHNFAGTRDPVWHEMQKGFYK